MNNYKVFIVGLLLVLLVVVRFLEKRFFDDGLIDFFRHAYLTEDLPSFSVFRTLLVDSFRFVVNSILSVAILYMLFKQKDLLKFLFIIYLTIFVVAVLFFYYELTHYQTGEYIRLFYVRRLLIQPFLLIILAPALLYQKKSLD